MSVIIKGMEMPKSCKGCQLHDRAWCSVTKEFDLSHEEMNEIGVHNCCPLVEIPNNHGRISDMDEAIKCIEECEGEDATYAIGLIEWACGKRTLLEAEREEK